MDERADAHSFVVRIWVEEHMDSGATLWRGHITHVIDRHQRSIDSVDQLVDFISQYVPVHDSEEGSP